VNAQLDSAERLGWERGLLSRLRAGEVAAFEQLYDAYAKLLYARVLYPALGNRDAAEDALAETFRVAFERISQFELGQVSIYFWLARIAKNKALDMYRARSITGRVLANFEALLTPLRSECSESDSPEFQLSEQVERARVQQVVERALSRLNERYRQAILLRFFEDRSREECAALLEVKVGTFDVLLLRALRSFKKQWEVVTAQGEVAYD
jgi:RNA polymerase sigma factor (sigma-70 family)